MKTLLVSLLTAVAIILPIQYTLPDDCIKMGYLEQNVFHEQADIWKYAVNIGTNSNPIIKIENLLLFYYPDDVSFFMFEMDSDFKCATGKVTEITVKYFIQLVGGNYT